MLTPAASPSGAETWGLETGSSGFCHTQGVGSKDRKQHTSKVRNFNPKQEIHIGFWIQMYTVRHSDT